MKNENLDLRNPFQIIVYVCVKIHKMYDIFTIRYAGFVLGYINAKFRSYTKNLHRSNDIEIAH